MARLQSAFAKPPAFCTRATIPRPASSATIVTSGGPFLGPNAITEVDFSSAWTRIIAPFPRTQPCQYRQHDAGPFLAGSRHADIFPWTIDWKKARAQQHVTCVGKEAAESSELCLDGLDRQEQLSQYAQALQSALAAQQISDMAVQTLAHEKFDPQDPPEPAIGPVLQLVRSAFSGLLNSMTRRGPKKGTL